MPTKSTGSKSNTKTTRSNAVIARENKRRQMWSVLLFALGVLLIIFSFVGNSETETPNLADSIHTILCGLFGLSTFFIGPIVIYVSVILSANKDKSTVGIKLFQLVCIVLLFSAAMQIIFAGEIGSGNGFFESIGEVYGQGMALSGGGVFGMILGFPLLLFGRAVAGIIIILIAFVVIMITANISLLDFLKIVAVPFKKLGLILKNKRDVYREESDYLRSERERQREEELMKKATAKEIEEQISKSVKTESIKKFTSAKSVTGSNNDIQLNSSQTPLEEQKKENQSFREELNAYISENTTKNKAIRPLFEPLPQNVENDEDETENSGYFVDSDTYNVSTGKKENKNVETIIDTDFESKSDSGSGLIPDSRLNSEQKNKDKNEKTFDKIHNNAVLEAIEDFKKEIDEEFHEKGLNEKKLLEAVGYNSDEVVHEIEIDRKLSNNDNFNSIPDISILKEQYKLPPVILLNEIVPEKSSQDIETELEANSVTLTETLKSFGVQTKIVGICRGPSVTRYEIQPAAGVKISKITGLIDDIALNLATAGVRIEAPIPNKAAVGIEVPNKKIDTVHFRSLVDSDTFRDNQSKLAAVIGVDISGEIILADISKMPHILIAGTTGSGKSVCVNSIIMSILFRSTPDEVRLLMIDPKAVEFMIYNGIPHLLIPVVTDPKKAAGALGWAVTEMLNRYKMFADNNVRDISGYNSLVKGDPELEPMPQIVIFIDELADLMMASPGEVEDSICRLAQMARAAGMHLVIATQRPSVNVVTGVIKANIPSRIALKVASQVDSRTIIDSAGAEKLLGKGDMLYFPVGAPKPMRVQGCWVSDKEVERVVDFIKNSFILDYDEKVMEEIDRQAELSAMNGKNGKDKDKTASGDIDVSDDKLDEAIEAVIEAGQASTSYLQRKLKLGYGRAARLIDIMEEMGVVGAFEGSKPRQVIMTKQDWYERKMKR